MKNTINHLTKKDLVRWLQSKPKDTVVGFSMVTESCPVTNFYKETIGPKFVTTGFTFHVINNTTIQNRPWLQRFITLVDKNREGIKITAAEALKALKLSTLKKH